MNIQNLMAQMSASTNPMQMMMSMLSPNQKQVANQLQGKSKEEQAQAIADYCNKNNISKEQLQNILNMAKTK